MSVHADRLKLRTVQSKVRQQLNTLLRILDTWQAVIKSGTVHCQAAANATLTLQYIPHMPKGVLKDVPGLQNAATSKLSQLRLQALGQLQEGLQELQLCVQTLRDLDAAFAACREDCQVSDEAIVVGQHSIKYIGLLWHKAVDMHEAELQVKCEAAMGLRSAAEALWLGAEATKPAEGSTSSKQQVDWLRQRLEVLVNVWTTNIKLEDSLLREALQQLTDALRF